MKRKKKYEDNWYEISTLFWSAYMPKEYTYTHYAMAEAQIEHILQPWELLNYGDAGIWRFPRPWLHF